MTLAIKVWFCVAVAIIAAAIADPLVEWGSNAGWFGPGNFTDQSNWNVVPALLVGLIFVALHLSLRIRSLLVGEQQAGPNWLQLASKTLGTRAVLLVPAIFAAQILALYLIETSEQLVVFGHALGGTVWLGGPIAASLAAHAIICGLVAVVAAWVLRAFADATVQLVRLVRAYATLRACYDSPTFLGRPHFNARGRSIRVLCRIGERAPPILTV